MCGIAGFYSLNKKFTEPDAIAMNNAMQHRGPDAAQYQLFNDTVGLAHRRLSIIDLSAAANQPMTSACGRYVMVFNGEVYNFQDIAKKLNKTLKTHSDTEVILEAFAQWGINFVQELNGMFAIAIFDKQTQKLYLFRDRLGIKPIYYYLHNQDFAFASELKALKTIKSINFSYNPIAIAHYLHLGYIPEPHSIYKNIYKFPAGNYAVFDGRELTIQPFWDIADKITPNIIVDETEAKNQLHTLLKSAVQYRLISDVPFGTFLSGGTDSSLVTAIAQNISDEPINTFAIGFEDKQHNEAHYARMVAKHLGTKHHELTVTEKDALRLVPLLPNIYDEPFADSSAIPTLMVSQFAKKYVTMTLSGDGGDELFMGYGRYQLAGRLKHPLLKNFRHLIALGLSFGNKKAKRYAKYFDYLDNDFQSHLFSQDQYLFTKKEIEKILLQAFYTPAPLSNKNILNRNLSIKEQQTIFDLQHYLKDDLLVKVDRASMFYSLETRVPLLDYRVVELAMAIAENLKIKNGVQKYLLKAILSDYIPHELVYRPKWGFSVPLHHWLKKDLNYLVKDYLNQTTINKHGVLNYKLVKQLVSDFEKGNHYLYNRVWALVVLQMFFEKN